MRMLVILMLVLLTACSSPAPAPADHFYRLPGVSSGHDVRLTDGVLLVEPFKASGLIRERAIIYVDGEDSVELERYHYHLWHESPAYMLQRHLADYLRDAGSAATVTTAHSMPADAVIRGELNEFMRIHADGGDKVVVGLELRLQYPGNNKRDFYKRYKEYEPVDGRGVDAVVKAFSRALNRIYDNFAAQSQESSQASRG